MRAFAWAAHYLSLPAPAVYLTEGSSAELAAVMLDEPTVLVGAAGLSGRPMKELAFLSARHLAYHVGAHRLLLFYPSLEELTACFLAAVRIAAPDLVAPVQARGAAELAARISPLLRSEEHRALYAAVAAFDAGGGRADLAGWIASVERAAGRTGLLLSGDVEAAVRLSREATLGLVPIEEKADDLRAYAVSDAYAQLRVRLGLLDPEEVRSEPA